MSARTASNIWKLYVGEIEHALTPKLSLFIIPAVAITGWLILGNVRSIWAIPILFLTSAMWGFMGPLTYDFMQKLTSSDRRATILSIRSFLTRGMFFIIAPLLG